MWTIEHPGKRGTMKTDISGDLITSFQCGESYSSSLHTYVYISLVPRLISSFRAREEKSLVTLGGSNR